MFEQSELSNISCGVDNSFPSIKFGTNRLFRIQSERVVV
jgi:hypothetical protein